jgi:tripartite ATP-independent transporter DctM subunit
METLALLMVLTLGLCLLIGYPVAFTLGGVSLAFGLVGFGSDFFTLLPMRIWTRMNSYILMAVPLFVFMGMMLERSGTAEELLETMGILFGKLRGGLAISVVIVGAILAASTGIVGATVITMGIIALPVMMRKKYKPELATGTISAAGTLGQIIPPSVVLVIIGDAVGVCIGDLFIGAIIPGILLTVLLVLYILVFAVIKPTAAPGLSQEEWDQISLKELAERVIKSLLPPALLILSVLGSIFFGIASPTEASAMGAFGATLLALFRNKLSLKALRDVVLSTTRISTMAFMIMMGATAFGLVFRGLDGDMMVRNFLLGLGGGSAGAVALIMATLFVLGFFLDFIEISFIVVPVLVPIVNELGIDLLWFSILMAVNFQTSFLTPPFGMALFYLKGVCPSEVTSSHIYRGVLPFVLIQLLCLIIIALFPSIVTYLPDLAFR